MQEASDVGPMSRHALLRAWAHRILALSHSYSSVLNKEFRDDVMEDKFYLIPLRALSERESETVGPFFFFSCGVFVGCFAFIREIPF